MRSSHLSLVLFTFLAAVFLGVLPCEAAPRVQVDNAVFDAGRIPEGMEVTHDYLFRNTGDQALTIKPKAC